VEEGKRNPQTWEGPHGRPTQEKLEIAEEIDS